MSKTRARYWAIVFVFVVSLPAVTTRIYATDEVQYFAYLRSLWFDGDVSFENEYRHFHDIGVATAHGFAETHLQRTTETGLRLNFGTVGSAILWAPFYGLADLYVIAANAAGRAIPRDGYAAPYIAAVCYGSAVYGLLALLLSLHAAGRLLPADTASAFTATLAIWLGTPLLFYMYVAPVMAHATSAFCVALFAALWLRVRTTWSLPGVAGLAATGALMVMVREQDVMYMAGPAIDYVVTHGRGRPAAALVRRTLARVTVGGVVFAAVYLPQALSYVALNGGVRPASSVVNKMNWASPHALQVLASPSHGFFVWTPLGLLAFGGLMVFCARVYRGTLAVQESVARGLALGLIAMLALQVYLLGSVGTWSAAGAFGQRRFVGSTALLVVGLAGLLHVVRGRRAAPVLAALVVVGIYWNLSFSALFGTGMMDRQRIELRRNVRDAFITLPRMVPSLAYRYVFERDSFYRTRPKGAPSARP